MDSNKRKADAILPISPVVKKRKLAVRSDVAELQDPHPNYNADITKILAGKFPFFSTISQFTFIRNGNN